MSTSCREYPGAVDKDGYGRRDLKRFSSTRLPRQIMEMVLGPEALEGKVVRHTCDNPPCFLYEHLVLGTVADNNSDRVARGRHHNAVKTHCKNGHEFTPENTYRRSDNGGRRCKACAREFTDRYLAKKV